MTTAPMDNRGGNQNGPQNNPTMINPLGGNGQSGKGQPTMYIPGMKSLGSTGESTMAQQSGAAMYREVNNEPTSPSPVPITAESMMPEQSVLDGAPMGPGAMDIPVESEMEDEGYGNGAIIDSIFGESTVDKAVFVGSTADLLKKLKNESAE